MKKVILSSLLMLGIFFVSSAQADWVIFQKVEAIQNAGNQIYFKINVSDPNSPCTWKNAWALSKDHPDFDEIYTMLLTAYIAEKPGRVAGSGYCESQNYRQFIDSFLLGVW